MSSLTPPSDAKIFDFKAIEKNRNRIKDQHCAIRDEVVRRLYDRFLDVNRDFKNVLVLSHDGRGGLPPDVTGQYLPLREEVLIADPASFDAVVAPLQLHFINDLPGVLLQIGQSLKPDGLFLGAMFGGETLSELRQVLMEAEMNITGGVSPRVIPFADIRDMGALMQRAGFALPVVDRDLIRVSYSDMIALMHDVRGMGEGNPMHKRSKTFMRRDVLAEAGRLYQMRYPDGDGGIEASFEVFYLTGWHPHDSQQKPLTPGSGQVSMEDVLPKGLK